MGEPHKPVEPRVCSPPSIAEILRDPLDIRWRRILHLGKNDLAATLVRLAGEGLRVPSTMERRLAWAVAFNMNGLPQGQGTSSSMPHRRMSGYQDRWPLDAPFTEAWSTLTRPLMQSNPGPGSVLLDELALSVLCEQNNDWQDPASRPIDIASANQAFEFVYAKNKAKVIGDIRRSFGDRADNPEAIADEAWARVFCDYWSVRARRRFLGLCRISTLVCQVARYIAIDLIRDRGVFVGIGESSGEDSTPGTVSLEDLGITVDPATSLIAEELKKKITECVGHLPARQRIVVEMVWFQEIRAKDAAEMLHISEPAVSQHLKKARETVRQCLKTHGFDAPR